MIYKDITWTDWQKLNDKQGYYCVLFDTNKYYFKDNLYHREDGAAIEWYDRR